MAKTVQLCSYVDRFGSGNLSVFHRILNERFPGVFAGVHLLPFFYPYDGADAGFDPIDHSTVDERLGDWSNVKALSEDYVVMADMIVNHMSADSPQFKDYVEKGRDSEYADLFLSFDSVFPEGASEQELLEIYRPRPGFPFNKMRIAGEQKLIWTTFTPKQIDIDVFSQQGKAYLTQVLDALQSGGVTLIRLDAAGYAVKNPGSSCFMTQETFDFIAAFTEDAQSRGMEVLVEIHSHFMTQVGIAKHASLVYDFALPPLVLHALLAADCHPLHNWYQVSPRNCITVLDTHDGIGIVDIAPDKKGAEGLISAEQIDQLVESIHDASGSSSRKATGAAASNLDLYQVNCTFYDALGADDDLYLIARLLQFLSPGTPQVYYVGLLAGKNDMRLLAETGVGRDINRHYYSEEEIEQELGRPVVQNLVGLIAMRNTHPAFDGEFSSTIDEAVSERIAYSWRSEAATLSVAIDARAKSFNLVSKIGGSEFRCSNWAELAQWAQSLS